MTGSRRRISTGRYANVSEYFRDLVRRDQECREGTILQLRNIIDRAEASGLSGRTLPEIMEAARVEACERGLLRDIRAMDEFRGLEYRRSSRVLNDSRDARECEMRNSDSFDPDAGEMKR